MADTAYVVTDAMRPRIARRFPADGSVPATAYADWFETRAFEETPWPASGVYATARDLAIFGQLFLQRGRYGEARVLSPASVAAMTRDQTAGVGLEMDGEVLPEASWGLGWRLPSGRPARRGAGLPSVRTFEHHGLGDAYLWVDPAYELVGVCLPVLRTGAAGYYPGWRTDRFVDAITGAIDAEEAPTAARRPANDNQST